MLYWLRSVWNLYAVVRSPVKPQTSTSLDSHVNQPLPELCGGFLHAHIYDTLTIKVSPLCFCAHSDGENISLRFPFHRVCHSGAPLTASSCQGAEKNYRTGATLTELRKSALILMAYHAWGEGVGGFSATLIRKFKCEFRRRWVNEGRVRALASVFVSVSTSKWPFARGSLSSALTHLSGLVQQPALLDSLHQGKAAAVSTNSPVFPHLSPSTWSSNLDFFLDTSFSPCVWAGDLFAPQLVLETADLSPLWSLPLLSVSQALG